MATPDTQNTANRPITNIPDSTKSKIADSKKAESTNKAEKCTSLVRHQSPPKYDDITTVEIQLKDMKWCETSRDHSRLIVCHFDQSGRIMYTEFQIKSRNNKKRTKVPVFGQQPIRCIQEKLSSIFCILDDRLHSRSIAHAAWRNMENPCDKERELAVSELDNESRAMIMRSHRDSKRACGYVDSVKNMVEKFLFGKGTAARDVRSADGDEVIEGEGGYQIFGIKFPHYGNKKIVVFGTGAMCFTLGVYYCGKMDIFQSGIETGGLENVTGNEDEVDMNDVGDSAMMERDARRLESKKPKLSDKEKEKCDDAKYHMNIYQNQLLEWKQLAWLHANAYWQANCAGREWNGIVLE